MGILQSTPINGQGHPSIFDPVRKDTREELERLIYQLSPEAQLSGVGEKLVAAYFLGKSPSDLSEIFESKIDPLAIENSADIERYEMFLAYFHDLLKQHKTWRKVYKKSKDKVFDGLWAFDMRALIHLGCASEINHDYMAMQALAMAACALPENPRSTEDNDIIKNTNALMTATRAMCTGGVSARAAVAVLMLLPIHVFLLQEYHSDLTAEIRERWYASGCPIDPATPESDTDKRAGASLRYYLNVQRTWGPATPPK